MFQEYSHTAIKCTLISAKKVRLILSEVETKLIPLSTGKKRFLYKTMYLIVTCVDKYIFTAVTENIQVPQNDMK